MEKNTSNYELNAYNIRVRKCCASCAYKGYINNGRRICIKDNMRIKGSYCCDQWQMSEGLKLGGRYRGVVRDKETKETVIE